jgi:hypothetical protein
MAWDFVERQCSMVYVLLEVQARLTHSTAKFDVKDHSMKGYRPDDKHLLRAASVGRASVEDRRAKESFSVDTQRHYGHFNWSLSICSTNLEPDELSLNEIRKAHMTKLRCSIPEMSRWP